jgi:hypothetical protein
MKKMITLSDGRTLTWDEFSALSEAEQNEALKPQKKPIAEPDKGVQLSNRELLPRIRAAAERNKLSEEDLLAFIKIMHDIFFHQHLLVQVRWLHRLGLSRKLMALSLLLSQLWHQLGDLSPLLPLQSFTTLMAEGFDPGSEMANRGFIS